MVIQPGNMPGEDTVLIWLSKIESNDSIIQEIINDVKKKYRVCVYRSGQVPSEEIYKKVIMDNVAK